MMSNKRMDQNKQINPYDTTVEDYLFDEDYLENFYFDDGDEIELPYESAMEP